MYNGTWTNEDLWWLLTEKAVELGGTFDQMINPLFTGELKSTMVNDSDFGNISVYDLVMKRYDQMAAGGPDEFDPFEGPIYDNKGTLQVPEGDRASKGDLISIMYFVDNVVGDIPQ